MAELLQFMYQGEVNVKQAELQAFMSIAESLQIKGLATSTSSNSHAGKAGDAVNSTYSQFHVARNHNQHHFNSGGNHTENHRQTTSTPLSSTSSVDNQSVKGEINALPRDRQIFNKLSRSTEPFSAFSKIHHQWNWAKLHRHRRSAKSARLISSSSVKIRWKWSERTWTTSAAIATWTIRLITWRPTIFSSLNRCSRKWQSTNLRATTPQRWNVKTAAMWPFRSRKVRATSEQLIVSSCKLVWGFPTEKSLSFHS